MKKIISVVSLIVLCLQFIQAQTSEDALRYSRVNYGGTARFGGLSGAFGALGADFSTTAINPAGIGLYSMSEMTFTFAPIIGNTSSTYNGTTATNSRTNFGIGNFGFVFNINPSTNSTLKSINIGFGFNRQNDFNSSTRIVGFNAKNSLMSNYTDILNREQVSPSVVRDLYPFDMGLAYAANLVPYDTIWKEYYCDAAYGGVTQKKDITTYGSMNELDFTFSANFSNNLFIGITFGIPMISYYENSVYREENTFDTIPEFKNLTYVYNLQTKGTGFNLKAGVIYKPIQWFRVGLAVHTPTWYPAMQDEWFSSMQSSFTTTLWNSTQYSPVGYYDYKLRTPFRAIGSLAFFVGQYGLVSADYEYVNYSQARLNSSGDPFTIANNEILTNYRSWGNIRIGTEWALSNFRLRGGFAYFSDPYTSTASNGQRFQASAGFGYRSKYFFADVSYIWSKMNQDYYLYDANLVNPAHVTYYTNTVLTTVGFRF